MPYTDHDLENPDQAAFDREIRDEAVRQNARDEGWGLLAEAAGFDPATTESAARNAFRFAHNVIADKDAQIARLQGHLVAVRDADVLAPGSVLDGRVRCALPGDL